MNTFKLSANANSDVNNYLTATNARNKNEKATLTLATKTFKGEQAKHLQASNLHVALTSKVLFSLTKSGASIWLLDLLKGKNTPCPIDKASGLYSNVAIQYFITLQDQVAKDCTKVEAPADLINATEVNNTPQIGDAPKAELVALTADVLFADWLTLSGDDKVAFTKLVAAHNKANKLALKVAI